jgi:transketolase
VRKILIETILDYSTNNQTPFLLTGDLGYSVLEPFKEKYPDSFINVGVMEQSMMSIAAGISSQNRKVFAYSIANFATFRALEQLRLDIGYHNLDVCVVGVGTGFQYGTAGYSHWSIEDLAIVSALERFRIFSPADSFSTEKAVSEFLNNGGPTYIRLGKHEKNLAEICAFTNLGKHVRVFGNGPNIIATHGSIACDLLESSLFDMNLYSVIVFDEVSTILDESISVILKSATTIKVLEEVIFPGSLGSRICRHLIDARAHVNFDWVGIDSTKIKSAGGSQNYLRSRELGPDYVSKTFNLIS